MQGLWVEYEDWGGVGVNVGSSQAYCGEGRGEREVCARGTVWQRSGGGPELAHSEESDHTITSSTARAAGWGLRLGPQGERKLNAVYACE